VAGVDEPFDEVTQLTGGERGRVVVGTQPHGVWRRGPRRPAWFQRGELSDLCDSSAR
jgi:hypothetical protein